MKIVVLDDYADRFRHVAAFERLAGHEVQVFLDSARDARELARRLNGADACVLTQQRTRLPRTTVEALETLRCVSQTGRNTGHVDLDACTERGIVVCAGGAGLPEAPAELAWGLIIAALRHLPYEMNQLRAGQWQTTSGTSLHGKTLGIYAHGRIGGMVAAVGRAFGMRVVCWGREGSLARAREAGCSVASDREAFFATADVLSLHLALTPQTRGIVTAADLAVMKPTALLVNTSRAEIIAPGALVAGLRQGRPGRAAVDVYEEEPVLGASHPLLGLPNVLCTPHLGYAVDENYEAIYAVAIDQLLAFAAGEPINVINREALPRRA